MDMEKVIKGLTAHADGCGYRSHHCDDMECPYRYGDESCDIEEMCRDAVALLKEQEHKDKMFHALEDDWKRLKDLLKEKEEHEPTLKEWTAGEYPIE